MKKRLLILHVLLYTVICSAQTPGLKSIVYDFDGLDIGQINLPDGDYRNNDLSYQIAATPLVTSDVLGDRALQLNINWATGTGEFGKAISRFIDLDVATDYVNFYFYNPLSNGTDSLLQLVITEDDNSNNIYEPVNDDKWVDTITIHRQGGWQLISIPLSAFVDENPGGNGVFDAGYGNTGSMLFSLGFVFIHTSAATTEQYHMDMICFSEGTMPTGAGILDLPPFNVTEHCLLGALSNNDFPNFTPDTINTLLSPNKLKYVNWFLNYAKTGITPNLFPGAEVSNLLNAGYTPIITWEMMYESYPRLHPFQPRLDQILNGSFDSYIDDFADQIKSYNQPIILRIFHEFEGNWYSWSLTENNSDPNKYIAAWRYVVDRFRARGAYNAQWMWCVNAEPKPYVDYNWILDAYPGSTYVDIVATDIYNHPDLGVPDWKSFRYTIAESYYYLLKHFSDKPLFICEVSSRERYTGESTASQTKAEWICQMSKDLQSYFPKTKALVLFGLVKEHDWRINSSAAALSAMNSCIWNNSYFIGTDLAGNDDTEINFNAYPNPFNDEITINIENPPFVISDYQIEIHDITGQKVFETQGARLPQTIHAPVIMASGAYILSFSSGNYSKRIKMIKVRN